MELSVKDVVLDPTQLKAVELCASKNRIVPITGPAGSGKTTVMREVYHGLVAAGHTVALCAPTGKAAKRIREVTGIHAQTIHRLLEFTFPGERDEVTGKVYGTSIPRRNVNRPLGYHVVIADEYAMVNRELHQCLVWGIPKGGRLLVFGDINQLQPIEDKEHRGKPSPFQAALAKFEHVVLDTIHRQREGSGILDAAQRVLHKRAPTKSDDFDITITDEPIPYIKDFLQERDRLKDFGGMDAQIITPSNRSFVGRHALNSLIQLLFERGCKDPYVDVPRHEWDKKYPLRIRTGTKVIQNNNDYQLNVFNGEVGIVKEISDLDEVLVDFGDRFVNYPPIMEYTTYDPVSGNPFVKSYDPRKELQLAYAITTHKSQGSEFDHVLYVMNKAMTNLQIRSNLYTGITRASRKVTLVTDKRSLVTSVLKEETTF